VKIKDINTSSHYLLKRIEENFSAIENPEKLEKTIL
jgi:hypothetical protein